LDQDLLSVAPQLKQALFDHYEPYAEAVHEGELEADNAAFPRPQSGAAALGLAEVEAVLVVELDGALATEVCYRVLDLTRLRGRVGT
jgi:hypothetical protein